MAENENTNSPTELEILANSDAAPAGDPTTERKALQVFDLHTICHAADGIGGLFVEDGEFTVAIAEHCGCGEVERFVALLQALDHYSIAAALLEHHIEYDQCEPSSHPDAAAVFAAA